MKLFGASGHAKVIIDILDSQGIAVEGIFDDNKEIKKILDYQVDESSMDSPLIICIGDNKIRRKLVERFAAFEFGKAIHATAQLSKYASVGEGTVMMHGAIVQASSVVGKHCIINTGASVDHDCTIEDFVHLSPQVTLCGNVHIGEGTHIGAGTVVLPGVSIGKWCVVGAGSVVAKDLPDFVLAVGNRCEIKKRGINQEVLMR